MAIRLIVRSNGVVQYTRDDLNWETYDPNHPAALSAAAPNAQHWANQGMQPGEYTQDATGQWINAGTSGVTGGQVGGTTSISGIGPGVAGGLNIPTTGIDYSRLEFDIASEAARQAENQRQFNAQLAFGQQELAQGQQQFEAGLAFDQQALAQNAALAREGWAQEAALNQATIQAQREIAMMEDATRRWLAEKDSALQRELFEKESALRLQLQNNDITLQKFLQEREIAHQTALQGRELAQRESEFARSYLIQQAQQRLEEMKFEFDRELAAASLRANPRDWVANAYLQRELQPGDPALAGQTPASDEMLQNMPWLRAIQANVPLPEFQGVAGQINGEGQPFGIQRLDPTDISAPVAGSLTNVEREMTSGLVSAQGQSPEDWWERASRSWITGNAGPGELALAA